MDYSDLDLIHGVKNGDKSALDLLVRRWYPRIYSYSLKMTANEQDAYDITQDVFLSVLKNIQAFYPWKSFDSWLFTIAHNKCMDYFRLQRRDAVENVMDLDRPEQGPSLDERVTVSVAIEEALARLSPAQRQAVIFHYFYQFTAKEIAHMTHTPLPTIKSRLSSAKKLLKNFFGRISDESSNGTGDGTHHRPLAGVHASEEKKTGAHHFAASHCRG